MRAAGLARVLRVLAPRRRPEKIDPAPFLQTHELQTPPPSRAALVADHVARFAVDDPAHALLAADRLRGGGFMTFEAAALGAFALAHDVSGLELLELSAAQSDELFHLVAPRARPSGETIEVFGGVSEAGSWSMVLPTPAGTRRVRDTRAVI